MESDRWTIDVYYRPPRSHSREPELTEQVDALGGLFQYSFEGDAPEAKYICLTYGFDGQAAGEAAAEFLRRQGWRVDDHSRYAVA